MKRQCYCIHLAVTLYKFGQDQSDACSSRLAETKLGTESRSWRQEVTFYQFHDERTPSGGCLYDGSMVSRIVCIYTLSLYINIAKCAGPSPNPRRVRKRPKMSLSDLTPSWPAAPMKNLNIPVSRLSFLLCSLFARQFFFVLSTGPLLVFRFLQYQTTSTRLTTSRGTKAHTSSRTAPFSSPWARSMHVSP